MVKQFLQISTKMQNCTFVSLFQRSNNRKVVTNPHSVLFLTFRCYVNHKAKFTFNSQNGEIF